ncbi:MAG: SIS domain-containing protein [Verrucomicrobia bacterium]|nr:SIS domain-containing protein [Verrucomicrobiota bacterium]
MNAMDRLFDVTLEQLQRLKNTQWDNIGQAATWVGDALAQDHWLYAFGTGHSHLLAEEIFFRAGGLVRGVPMLDEKLMLHKDAIQATLQERKEGYAETLLNLYPVETGDVLIVASNSGRNAVPVETVFAAQQRGLKVIAVTNLAHSREWPSRHPSGKTLAEAADLVIDNCGISGDACLDFPGMPSRVGPTSTVTGALIINLIIVQAIENSLNKGFAPEIYISSNSDGDDHNEVLLRKYKNRIRHL